MAGHALQTRHWALISLGAIGTALLLSGRPDDLVERLITPIIAGIGGMLVWDKIEKYSSAGRSALALKGSNPT